MRTATRLTLSFLLAASGCTVERVYYTQEAPCVVPSPPKGAPPIEGFTVGAPVPAPEPHEAPAEDVCAPLPDLPPTPLGWSDPVLLWQGSTGEADLACPDNEAPIYVGNVALTTEPHTCEACKCAPDTTAMCRIGQIVNWSSLACGEPHVLPYNWSPMTTGGADSGVCDESENAPLTSPPASKVTMEVSLATYPENTPQFKALASGGAPVKPPTSWDQAVACQIGADGCGQDETRVCVFSGDEALACPDSYPDRIETFTGVEDGRACSPCACSRQGQEHYCEASFALYEAPGCAGNPAVTAKATTDDPMHKGCADLDGSTFLHSFKATIVAESHGPLTPKGGAPIGELSPTGVSVFCCLAAGEK